MIRFYFHPAPNPAIDAEAHARRLADIQSTLAAAAHDHTTP